MEPVRSSGHDGGGAASDCNPGRFSLAVGCRHDHLAPDSSTVGAVVLAAGTGERLGRGPKALVPLAGRPLLDWTLRSVLTNSCVREVVVAVHPAAYNRSRAVAADAARSRHVIRVVTGGRTRQDSVLKGLAALRRESRYVATVDAARPLTPPRTIDRLCSRLHAARRHHAVGVVPGVPLFDTIRKVDDQGYAGCTVNREELRAVQAPQLFCRQCLAVAHQQLPYLTEAFTDEAGLVGRCGGRVLVAPGHSDNFKITIADDLRRAEALLAASSVSLLKPW